MAKENMDLFFNMSELKYKELNLDSVIALIENIKILPVSSKVFRMPWIKIRLRPDIVVIENTSEDIMKLANNPFNNTLMVPRGIV